MSHYREQVLARDFSRAETFFLQTLDEFVFIELGTRRVHLAGCIQHPNAAWVNQRARQVVSECLRRTLPAHSFSVRDNDLMFTKTFDTIVASQKLNVTHAAVHVPKANAFADRWIRLVRNECLDNLLVSLKLTSGVCSMFRPTTSRSYQALAQQAPIPGTISPADVPVRCRPVLGNTLRSLPRRRLTKRGF